MDEQPKIGLDNPAFTGRLRQPAEQLPTPGATIVPQNRHQVAPPEPERSKEFSLTPMLTVPVDTPAPEPPVAIPDLAPVPADPPAIPPAPQEQTPLPVVKPEPFAQPAQPKLQPSNVLHRQSVSLPSAEAIIAKLNPKQYPAPHVALFGLAAIIMLLGVAVSWQTVQTNRRTTAQIGALSEQSAVGGLGSTSGPDIASIGSGALNQYTAAPDLARYVSIPKLGITARVMQLGMKLNGTLSTPDNIHDVGWYNGSAKPGQPGTALLDGFASSQASRGALYGANSLVANDMIQIVRGDGTALNYRVVKTQIYSATNVDMEAALLPVTAGKAGLNLLVYGGHQTPGTNQFSQRIIVFAEQI